MNPVEIIIEKLKQYPMTRFEAASDRISILPEKDGFSVSLLCTSNGFTVSYEGWHEHFKHADDALNCFAFGLSDSCRLKITSRGGHDYKWTVEVIEDAEWKEDWTTGLLFFKFWRRPQIRYLQNKLILDRKPKNHA